MQRSYEEALLRASKVFVVTSDLLEVSCYSSITTPQAFLCNTEEMNLKWNVVCVLKQCCCLPHCISSKLLIFFLSAFFFHVQSSKASHCASAASYSVVKLYFRKLLVSRFAYSYMQQLGVYFVSSVIKSWH